MRNDAQYDDGVRLCPRCHRRKFFQLSGIYFHCEFCNHDLSMEEFEAGRDPGKLPAVQLDPQRPGQPRPRVDEGKPKPDVHPLSEWDEIPDGVPEGDPGNF